MDEGRALSLLAEACGLPSIDPDIPCDQQLDSLQVAELWTATGLDLGGGAGIGGLSLREVARLFSAATRGSVGESEASHSRDAEPLVSPPIRRRGAVEMRPVGPSQMAFLYQLAVDERTAFRWRFRLETPTEETFARTLWPGVLVQFCVHLVTTGEPIGLVTCYGADMANGHANVGGIFAPNIHGTGLAISAVHLFIEYIFKGWAFRKLYFEVPEFNYLQFASGEGKLFQLEGRLREHDYYDGRYWDRLFLAVYPSVLRATMSASVLDDHRDGDAD